MPILIHANQIHRRPPTLTLPATPKERDEEENQTITINKKRGGGSRVQQVPPRRGEVDRRREGKDGGQGRLRLLRKEGSVPTSEICNLPYRQGMAKS